MLVPSTTRNEPRRGKGEEVLTEEERPERTAGGLLGAIAGKAKKVAGELAGNDNLAREGRLQQARVDAESEASRRADEARQHEAEADLQAEQAETESERERLEAEIASQTRAQQIERDREAAQHQAEADAREQAAAAERRRAARESAAESAEGLAERERMATAAEAIRLEQQARQAESNADSIDEKETK